MPPPNTSFGGGGRPRPPYLQVPQLHLDYAQYAIGELRGFVANRTPMLEAPKPDPDGLVLPKRKTSRIKKHLIQVFEDLDHSGPFRFMDLPEDVRVMVYEVLLAPPGAKYENHCRITAGHKRLRIVLPSRHHWIHTGILTASKEVHEEAEKVLYANDIFEGMNGVKDTSDRTKEILVAAEIAFKRGNQKAPSILMSHNVETLQYVVLTHTNILRSIRILHITLNNDDLDLDESNDNTVANNTVYKLTSLYAAYDGKSKLNQVRITFITIDDSFSSLSSPANKTVSRTGHGELHKVLWPLIFLPEKIECIFVGFPLTSEAFISKLTSKKARLTEWHSWGRTLLAAQVSMPAHEPELCQKMQILHRE